MEEIEVRGKENDKVEENVAQFLNMNRAEFMKMRKDMKTKCAEGEGMYAKLDSKFDQLKVYIAKMIEIVEECQAFIRAGRRESNEQYVLRDTTSTRTCKTNIVSPMVGGIPLKRARVSLKRLGPAPYDISQYGGASASQTRASGTSNRVQQNTSDASEAGPSSSRGHRRS